MRRLVLVALMACASLPGCASVPHREVSEPTIEEIDEPTEGDAADEEDADRPVRAEDVPPRVRTAAASALAGAPTIRYERTTSGQYEALGVIDGEEQEVTLSPGGWIIDTDEENIDDIDDDDGSEVDESDDAG